MNCNLMVFVSVVEAAIFCGDCVTANILCLECVEFAHKKGAKRGRTSTPIEDHLRGSAPMPNTLKCQHHPALELELFCRTCARLILMRFVQAPKTRLRWNRRGTDVVKGYGDVCGDSNSVRVQHHQGDSQPLPNDAGRPRT